MGRKIRQAYAPYKEGMVEQVSILFEHNIYVLSTIYMSHIGGEGGSFPQHLDP